MKTIVTRLFAIIALSSLVLASCSTVLTPVSVPNTSAPTATVAPKIQKLTIGMPISPRILDPDDQAQMSFVIYDLMYDKLVKLGLDGKVMPDLAESWESVNPTTWRFHLRKGVQFHNGEEFDAEAVRFTVEWNMDPKNKRMTRERGVQDVIKVAVVDKYTVDVFTGQAAVTLPAFFTAVYVLPPKNYTKLGPEDFNNAPVGTGPFKFVSWRRDENIILDANPNYWEGRPKLDSVEIRIIPEASSRAAALRAGEVQMLFQVFPEQVPELQQAGLVVTSTGAGQSYAYGFGRESQRVKPLQDKRVRQAIQYAIDKDAIVKAITGGFAIKLEGQMASSDAFGNNPELKGYPYDPERAKALLAEAGYPDGFTIPMKVAAGRYFKDKEATEAVISYLGKMGIKVDLELLESAVWAERYLNNKLDEGGMWNIAFNVLPAMDVVISYTHFRCESPRKIWCNKQFNELYAKQAAEFDANKRLAILRDMAAIIRDEAAFLYLYESPSIYALSPSVQDVVYYANGTINISKTYLK